jgi:hypothetical protein
MKKLFLILGLIVFTLTIFATNPDAYVMLKDGNYKLYTGVSSDTVSGSTTLAIDFFIEYSKNGPYTISFWIKGDTLAGCAGNTTIQVQGLYDLTYGTTTNIGSSITWTSASAVYNANTRLNTYSIAVAGTETTAAFNAIQDTTGIDVGFADTIKYAAQTNTVAVTNTVTMPGVDFGYIRFLFTGTTNTRIEVEDIGLKITPLFDLK